MGKLDDLKALAGRILVYLLVTGLFLVIQIVQIVFLVYLGFERVYGPLSQAPGARDGTGLLFVALGVLFGAMVAATIVGVVEVKIVQIVFPDWSPPDLDG